MGWLIFWLESKEINKFIVGCIVFCGIFYFDFDLDE